jgi:hypothetical protein
MLSKLDAGRGLRGPWRKRQARLQQQQVAQQAAQQQVATAAAQQQAEPARPSHDSDGSGDQVAPAAGGAPAPTPDAAIQRAAEAQAAAAVAAIEATLLAPTRQQGASGSGGVGAAAP